jgi:hypothetical protein
MTEFLPYITGPAGATAVLTAVLYAVYRFATDHLMPIAHKALDSHLARIDELSRNIADSNATVARLAESIDRRLAVLEDKLR